MKIGCRRSPACPRSPPVARPPFKSASARNQGKGEDENDCQERPAQRAVAHVEQVVDNVLLPVFVHAAIITWSTQARRDRPKWRTPINLGRRTPARRAMLQEPRTMMRRTLGRRPRNVASPSERATSPGNVDGQTTGRSRPRRNRTDRAASPRDPSADVARHASATAPARPRSRTRRGQRQTRPSPPDTAPPTARTPR